MVHDLCAPDQRILHLAAPCLSVDLERGVAVVPDPGSPTQILLVPTRRIAGIESPELLAPDAVNYWQAAWEARRDLADRLGAVPDRGDVGMAVNAVAGRSQAQLHIHIACVRPEVKMALAGLPLSRTWSPARVHGGVWRTRWVGGEDLRTAEPFALLARASPAVASAMGLQTLVVIGARAPDGRPGFHLLSRSADLAAGYAGHGEFLLDRSCRSVGARGGDGQR